MGKRGCILPVVLLVVMLFAGHVSAEVSEVEDLSHTSGKLGLYYALVVGIDSYSDAGFKPLKTASSDAKRLASLLRSRYGFRVEQLLNKKATKAEIEHKIGVFTDSGRNDESILIFFAGQGERDNVEKKGWWIPYDAVKGDVSTYVSNDYLQSSIREMEAKHTLIVSDSAFGDTYFGSSHKPRVNPDGDYYLRYYLKKSRWGITSGALSPLPDGGGRSLFSGKFIDYLAGNRKKYVTPMEIYSAIRKDILVEKSGIPRCRSIRSTGDQGGAFVFVSVQHALAKEAKVPVVAAVSKPAVTKVARPVLKKVPASTLVSVKSNVNGATIYIDGRGVGKTPVLGWKIRPGKHSVKIYKVGYLSASSVFVVKEGKNLSLNLRLEKEKPKPGNLFVQVKPSASSVKIIGAKDRYTPGLSLPPGKYEVEISAPLFQKMSRTVYIKPGKESRISASLDPVESFTGKMGGFVLIKPGSFYMGSPTGESRRNANELPHKVTLKKNFFMQALEVTVDQFKRFVMETNYKTEAESGDGAYAMVDYSWEQDSDYSWNEPGFDQSGSQPVVSVSWNDARAFIEWLNRDGKATYRLPTEAEWEYACRAGSSTPFETGKCLGGEAANIDGNVEWGDCPVANGLRSTTSVGSYPSNAWGLFDMHGNVREWCRDWFGPYASGPVTGPEGPLSGTSKVIRGGGWTTFAYNARSAKRFSEDPAKSYGNTGFRLVLEVPN